MKKIKFPSGSIGYELQHFMGIGDPKGHLLERPQIVQDMYNNDKCIPGKIAEYSDAEIMQLIKEVDNAADIKQDSIDDSRDNKWNWTSLHQYHLLQFGKKLGALLK